MFLEWNACLGNSIHWGMSIRWLGSLTVYFCCLKYWQLTHLPVGLSHHGSYSGRLFMAVVFLLGDLVGFILKAWVLAYVSPMVPVLEYIFLMIKALYEFSLGL